MVFFIFKQKTAYDMLRSLVGSEMCIRDRPEMENIVHPDDAMRYTESPEFPLGEERLVESARDGFDVRIDRTVYDGDEVILEDSFSSSFAPSYNTSMRGTGAG